MLMLDRKTHTYAHKSCQRKIFPKKKVKIEENALNKVLQEHNLSDIQKTTLITESRQPTVIN